MKYLTEENLGIELKKLYPGSKFIKDKQVPGSGLKTRPDYREEDLKIIVEYDGDQHYRSASKIKRERIKDETYLKLRYKVIRIPYFVQFSEATIKNLFGIKIKYHQKYPHGFISHKVILPADFCEMGVEKFVADLDRFAYIRSEIIASLDEKFKLLNDIDLVLPKSLIHLISK